MRAIGRAIGDTFLFIWRMLRALFNVLWGFMVVFSFIVNIVLVIVVAVLGIYIFQIKNVVADPLLKGLHSSFVGLDEATIDWMIPVRDSVQAQFDLQLQQNTVVVLTADVPLRVQADISGPVAISNATVALTLPAGTELPVALDLPVPVDEEIPVNLDVRAVIPLADTQLHDPFENLRLTFEPIILALDNLPNNFWEATNVTGETIVNRQPPNLFDTANSAYLQDPWPGFSLTAGLNYDLLAESRRLNTPVDPNAPDFSAQAASGTLSNVYLTGIVPLGGIPPLDQQIRPELYDDPDESPALVVTETQGELVATGIPPETFNGDFDELEAERAVSNGGSAPAVDTSVQQEQPPATGGATDDSSIVPDFPPQPAFTAVPNE